MKIAIYTRVSTKDKQTTENQVLELKKYAKAMGYDYEIFEEKESSRKNRPIKNKVFQDAMDKKYDMILVWKLDRWARSLNELVNDFDLMISHKVGFYSLSDGLTLDEKPANRFTAHILGAVAQFERELNKERILLGLERAKENGKKLGRPMGAKDKKRRKKSGYLLRWQNN